MNERMMRFRVGVLVLATFLVVAILCLMFTETTSLLHGTYTIYIKFDEAPGVSRDTPVRKDGIRIGRVRSVQFTDHDTGVVVTADIDSNRSLYSDEQCRSTYSLLMGDAALEFVRNSSIPGKPERIEPGAVLQGKSAPNLTGSLAGMQERAEVIP